MPHIHIDYSRNLDARLDMPALLAVLRDALAATGVFPLAGIRVRAVAVDHVVMADGNPQHGFLDISLRIGAGRDGATQTRVLDLVFAAAQEFCGPQMQQTSIMLSIELREIDAGLSRKASSIRDHLPKESQ